MIICFIGRQRHMKIMKLSVYMILHARVCTITRDSARSKKVDQPDDVHYHAMVGCLHMRHECTSRQSIANWAYVCVCMWHARAHKFHELINKVWS
jgi:hypothetical protein